jgi:hypothetical protein
MSAHHQSRESNEGSKTHLAKYSRHESVVEYEPPVSDRCIFRFTTDFTYFRTESPRPREDGTAPKSNDYQLVVGVLLKINE